MSTLSSVGVIEQGHTYTMSPMIERIQPAHEGSRRIQQDQATAGTHVSRKAGDASAVRDRTPGRHSTRPCRRSVQGPARAGLRRTRPPLAPWPAPPSPARDPHLGPGNPARSEARRRNPSHSRRRGCSRLPSGRAAAALRGVLGGARRRGTPGSCARRSRRRLPKVATRAAGIDAGHGLSLFGFITWVA